MDRNLPMCIIKRMPLVALRKESVDRNAYGVMPVSLQIMSLSARRAWIEIASCRRVSGRALSLSARRAWIEIDADLRRHRGDDGSLSARRAWIEIMGVTVLGIQHKVALRKESVDRNEHPEPAGKAQTRRSPQGERG